jgi:hypothetical protein
MTVTKIRTDVSAVKQLLASDKEFLKPLIQAAVQETLEAEMTETLGAEKGERAEGRLGYRSGYYPRSLITRVGKIELKVPQDRAGRFSTELFERYQRSEKALVAALAEMYVQGVSTRKVKQVTEELVGHVFSASAISAINKRLDTSLKAFCERKLKEPFPYLILDARYERVREDGIIASQAVLIAIGVDWDRHRAQQRVRQEIRGAVLAGIRTQSLGLLGDRDRVAQTWLRGRAARLPAQRRRLLPRGPQGGGRLPCLAGGSRGRTADHGHAGARPPAGDRPEEDDTGLG